jgi:hypothetical protein
LRGARAERRIEVVRDLVIEDSWWIEIGAESEAARVLAHPGPLELALRAQRLAVGAPGSGAVAVVAHAAALATTRSAAARRGALQGLDRGERSKHGRTVR